jgi:hypothetical protein
MGKQAPARQLCASLCHRPSPACVLKLQPDTCRSATRQLAPGSCQQKVTLKQLQDVFGKSMKVANTLSTLHHLTDTDERKAHRAVATSAWPMKAARCRLVLLPALVVASTVAPAISCDRARMAFCLTAELRPATPKRARSTGSRACHRAK